MYAVHTELDLPMHALKIIALVCQRCSVQVLLSLGRGLARLLPWLLTDASVVPHMVNMYTFVCVMCVCVYRIAGYIGGKNVWQIARRRKKIAIGKYKSGGYGTIATPFPGVYTVGAILADLILVQQPQYSTVQQLQTHGCTVRAAIIKVTSSDGHPKSSKRQVALDLTSLGPSSSRLQ